MISTAVEIRFKQDFISQIHLLERVFKIFPFSFLLHKILFKSKTSDISKENGTCLNQKTTVLSVNTNQGNIASKIVWIITYHYLSEIQ